MRAVEVVRLGAAPWEAALAPSEPSAAANGGLVSAARMLASRLYGQFAEPARPLPKRAAPVFCVGSTTLGGGGKTPFSLALARALSTPSRPVALVTHRYRALATGGRSSPLSDDERYLRGRWDYVYAAPTRVAAFAAVPPEMPIVVDGPLSRATSGGASLLLHDGTTPIPPHTPPAGPLRATLERLYAAADHRLFWGPSEHRPPGFGGVPIEFHLEGLEALAALPDDAPRILVTALARPERVVAPLAAAGVRIDVHLQLPDHGLGDNGNRPVFQAVSALLARYPGAVFVASNKCMLHLPVDADDSIFGRPLHRIDRVLVPPSALLSHLRRAV